MLPECFDLSVEQQFSIRSFEVNSYNLSEEQMRELLLEISRQLLIKDNVIRHLIKNGI
ncbi:NblA/ycf18 family protein [Alkalinema sp. FACHB-956]|uniref:NblA/ycf18 family protein n=1 Tax=Alkalinema sp. FACHB-956 TaxID=2692768 RepID=UPI0016890F78|nr:NblA/ycf18 family protein [Alkalinema sp. FACHB-956]MBD2328706.1 NblA/ycf18 family protein [Alkalinema sp. FACHB-956]